MEIRKTGSEIPISESMNKDPGDSNPNKVGNSPMDAMESYAGERPDPFSTERIAQGSSPPSESARIDSLLQDTRFEHLQSAVDCAANRISLGKSALALNGIQQDLVKAFPDATGKEQTQMSLVSLMVMMGDVVGALRAYAQLTDRQSAQFSHQVADKLDAIGEAREKILWNFAQQQPPKAYAGSDPQQAARSQDRQSKYTQFVQMTTQLMNEFQNTERELLDALSEARRNVDSLWESYAGLRDDDSRTTDRILHDR